jgi:hypothetical protein
MNSTPTIAAFALALLGVPLPASEQDSGQGAVSTSNFSQARLEQMVAPIALHPDALLTQILMASTYPIEVVEADTWIGKNPGLKGDALEEALKSKDWDPSVKALCGFPTVLKQMSDNLPWTRDLGDAFLGQKAELMDTVQRMRKKALASGALKTTEQQKVSQDGDAIVVEPASPEVVYVPAYSPVVVYGPGWSYADWYYPAFYAPPPYPGPFITFGFGFLWGSAFWGGCDWHHHTVIVDVVRYRRFTDRTCVAPTGAFLRGATSGQVAWTHEAEHRRGMTYRDPGVARPPAPRWSPAPTWRRRPEPREAPRFDRDRWGERGRHGG